MEKLDIHIRKRIKMEKRALNRFINDCYDSILPLLPVNQEDGKEINIEFIVGREYYTIPSLPMSPLISTPSIRSY